MNTRDRGSVSLFALVVTVIGASTIGAVSTLNIGIMTAQMSSAQRDAVRMEADSALTLASSRLRALGANPSQACPAPPMGMGDVIVRIECTRTGLPRRALPAGLVATLNASTVSAQSVPSWAGGIANAISGALVVNTGSTTSPSVSYLPNRNSTNSTSASTTWQTLTKPWSAFAATGDSTSPAGYPTLVPLPTYERPGAQALIGSCNVYFPGRYSGTSALVLSGGMHYFTSGVYYFERTLTISNGARVVMGDGTHPGCTDDVEASLDARAPRRHEIDQPGAALVFGSSARLVVQESSLVINARNDGIAVRTVGFGTSSSSVVIPQDSVRLGDDVLVPVSSHFVVPPESATGVSYSSSTLTPSTSFALEIRLNGTVPESNRVVIEGQVFTPNAGLRISSTTSGYGVALTGGIVASRLSTSLPLAPSGPGSGFVLGAVEAVQQDETTVTIEVSAVRGHRSATSTAVFDVGGDWRLIARSRRLRSTSGGG